MVKGESDTVALELVHITVKLVEHLIGIDKAVSYAAGATIIEVLQKMIPEPKAKKEQKEEYEREYGEEE